MPLPKTSTTSDRRSPVAVITDILFKRASEPPHTWVNHITIRSFAKVDFVFVVQGDGTSKKDL